MSAYWKVTDEMRIGQKYISVPSENGLEYSPEQKIQIYVGPETKYMDGHDSYLEFDFKISLGNGSLRPTRLQLDEMGGNALIRNIRIYDGSRGQLLEEIESYSSLCSVRYDYDADDSIRNMRALREGGGAHTIANRGTNGNTKSFLANTVSNAYFKKTNGNQNVAFDDDDFLTAKLTIPLHTGIFAENEHIFPIMMTNGLYIEIDTPPAQEVLKQLDSVLKSRRVRLNPFFHSVNGSVDAPDAWVNGSTHDRFFVDTQNNLSGADRVERFPFVIGERIGFVSDDINASVNNISTTEAEITEINASSNGLIEVVLQTGGLTNGNASVTSGDFVVYSRSILDATSYTASYTISNVNLVVSQVMLDPGYERGMLQKVREGKAIEIDILSATNYKHSILASDRQTAFQVYANNSRAKSLLVVPQDSTVYTLQNAISANNTYQIIDTDQPEDFMLNANRSAYTGICDQLKEYQYQIDGRLVPSRPIDVTKIASKKSIDAFHLYELEKCLDNAGIVPRSFRAFQDNFVFGRGFGVNDGAMDLRGKDLAVILKYTLAAAPTKPKLFNSFVVHVRRLMIRDAGVSVVL
jgi:hypothetical protein